MLELARGIRLGVDVRNLLELERAFEGDRVVDTPTQEERVIALGKPLGPGLDLGLEIEGVLDAARHEAQLREHRRLGVRVDTSLRLRDRERERE